MTEKSEISSRSMLVRHAESASRPHRAEKGYGFDERTGEVAPHDMGFGLNDLLLSAIATTEDRGYGRPKEAFKRLSVEKK